MNNTKKQLLDKLYRIMKAKIPELIHIEFKASDFDILNLDYEYRNIIDKILQHKVDWMTNNSIIKSNIEKLQKKGMKEFDDLINKQTT